MCISKEKTACDYLISLLKFSRKIPKLPRVGGGGGEVECQLRTFKSGVCLHENWMFVDRGEERDRGPKFRIFLRKS